MPLSFGVVIGLVIAFIGAFMFIAGKRKRTAAIVIGIGALITVISGLLILLAANSGM